jgi:hypothetical protein
VGDALREVVGAVGVRVMPTKGRDGSIDVFLEGDTAVPPLFGLLPGPIIVECKDNDDSLGRVRDNVAGAWKKVAKKLGEKAKERWPSPYDPWARTRSYVYLTSAVLPNHSAREELTKEITAFFADLRQKKLAAVEQVRVLDWSDLRPLLDLLPRLADRWLGLRLDALLGHADYLAEIASGFRRYLMPEVLPFVPPPDDQDAHPERLFERVRARARSDGGVLLTGAGGVAWRAREWSSRSISELLPSPAPAARIGRGQREREREREREGKPLDRVTYAFAGPYALTWLGNHYMTLDAGLVLPPLLGRRDLDRGQREHVATYALSWLARYPSSPDASFVLKRLLARLDLPEDI